MKTKRLHIIMFLLLIVTVVFASSDKYLDKLVNEYPDEMEAVAMYPEDVRLSILEMTQHPALLNDIGDLQKKTHKRFQRFITNFSRSDQEDVYELYRYPDLLAELVEGGKKSEPEAHRIIKEYPDDIYDIAMDWSTHRFSDLKSLRHFDMRTIRDFEKILDNYPTRVQDIAQEMINLPEVISILTEDMNFTVALGDLYHDDEEWLEIKVDSLNYIYAQENAQELADYRDSIENDPEAYEEMQNAARTYADDYNVDIVYDEPQVINRYHVVQVYRPYPYWYGYPHWRTTAYWRPVPWYYETGFYFGHGGRCVIFGLPSYHYVHWHHYRHPSVFPHLSQQYYVHYKRYPHSHNNFHRSVHRHVAQNDHVKVVNRNVEVKQRNYSVSRDDYKRSSSRRSTMNESSSRRMNSSSRDRAADMSRSSSDSRSSRNSSINNSSGNSRTKTQSSTTRSRDTKSDSRNSRVSESSNRSSKSVSKPASRSSQGSRDSESRKTRQVKKTERSTNNKSVSNPQERSSSKSSSSSSSSRSSRVRKSEPQRSSSSSAVKRSSSSQSSSKSVNRSSNNKSRSSANRSSSSSSRSKSSSKKSSSRGSSSRSR